MSLGTGIRERGRLLLATLLALLLALGLVAPVALAEPPVKTPGVPANLSGKELGALAPYKGMVSVAHPLAARAGAEMLEKGGNAIDAAAAIQFALNVEEPMMTGIGGGAFIMIYSAKDKKVYVIDARERSPLGLLAEPFPVIVGPKSGTSVGVPGTLLGTAAALERFGTMSLAEVMAPAIKMAEEGITVSPWLVGNLGPSTVTKLSYMPGNAYTFVGSDGSIPQAGDTLVQEHLAKTLKMIAAQGTDVFYKGEIADAISAIVKARGGYMEKSDLESYTVSWREPVRGSYRGWEVVSMPPPSSGGLTAIQVLEMLERFPLGQWGHNSERTLHTVIDAIRVAWADRAKYMADLDYVSMPMQGLLDPAYVASRASLINPDGSALAVPTYGTPGGPWVGGTGSTVAMGDPEMEAVESGETTHFVATDRWGNVVTWTTTIESAWGSGIMVPGYGFMLNNEMTDFDSGTTAANRIETGKPKRPRSSMTPTLLLKDGKPWMATGSPGGATIINTVLQIIMNVVDHGMTVEQAVLAPRFSHTSTNTRTTSWEEGISAEVRAALTARGHVFSSNPTQIGSAQSLVIDLQTGQLFGAGDPRREGTVISVKAGRNEAP